MEETAAAIFKKDSKILLEKRREDEDNYAGFWALPGGHKKEEETPEEALVREMKEELNVTVKKFKFIGKFEDRDPTSKKMYTHHSFLCEEWEGEIKQTTEQEKIEWIKIKELENLNIHPVDLKMLKAAKVL